MSRRVASVTTPNMPSEPVNKPDQIEAGLVLVEAAAGAQHAAVGQHHLQP